LGDKTVMRVEPCIGYYLTKMLVHLNKENGIFNVTLNNTSLNIHRVTLNNTKTM